MKIEKQRLSHRKQLISQSRSPVSTPAQSIVKPAPKRRRTWHVGIVILVGALIAGCSAFSSDTVRIVQQNADGTITAYSGTMTAAASTSAAFQGTAVEAATLIADYGTIAAQYNALGTQVNPTNIPGQAAPQIGGQSAPVPTSAAASNPGGSTLVAPPQLPVTSTVDPNAMVMDMPVMSTSIDNQGCAVRPTATFTLKDAKIYVVAKVHKLAKGVDFTAAWAGTINHSDSWTSDHAAASLCVHFYVDPNAINMTAGAWTVTLTMGNQPPQTLNFTIQDTSAAVATASQ